MWLTVNPTGAAGLLSHGHYKDTANKLITMTHYGYACNITPTPVIITAMKQIIAFGVIVALLTSPVWFDAIIIFLLSGFVPVIGITLEPSTMLAVMIASVALGLSLKRRKVVFDRCTELYDRIEISIEKRQKVASRPNLPKRRYQEL